MIAMKREEKGDTYSRFPSPPPPASPCRRRKTRPWQLEISVSLSLHASASPHPPTPRQSLIFIAPPLQYPRSSLPLRDLLASQALCFLHRSVSPNANLPSAGCPSCALPLALAGQGAGQAADHQSSSWCQAKPATSLLFPHWEQSQIGTKPVRCWYHRFSSFSCSFCLKFCPTGWGALRFDSSPTQLPQKKENQKEKVNLVVWDKNSLITENNNINKSNNNTEKERGREIKPKRHKWCPVLTLHWAMPSPAPAPQRHFPSFCIENEVPQHGISLWLLQITSPVPRGFSCSSSLAEHGRVSPWFKVITT